MTNDIAEERTEYERIEKAVEKEIIDACGEPGNNPANQATYHELVRNLALLIIADRQALLSRIEAAADAYKREIFGNIQGRHPMQNHQLNGDWVLEEFTKWRTAIQKEREPTHD